MTPEALAAIRAWTRLDAALAAYNRALERDHGVTGAQLAMLRLVDEWARPSVPLATLRDRLVLHPATLGQLLDRLAARDLVDLSPDPADRRRRLVTVTPAGHRLLAEAPLAGPVRLRHVPTDPARAARLAEALTDAVTLFGLDSHA